MQAEVEIAQLASRILGEPERYIDSFGDFFKYGCVVEGQKGPQKNNPRIRSLALLSGAAVIIDILPSLVMNDTHDDGEDDHKSSKDRLQKQKLASIALSFYDELLQRLGKNKIARGPSVMLVSSLCSKANLGQERSARLVSTVVSLACLPKIGVSALQSLKERIQIDSRNFVDNFDIVRLIVSSICREKNNERLNILLPVLEGLRLASVPTSSVVAAGGKVDRQLARDMATGRGDFLDLKTIKQNEGSILSDLIALFVRVVRVSSTPNCGFSPESVLIAVDGISHNAQRVNADLAIELQAELFKCCKYFLTNNISVDSSGILIGATSLCALLGISKGLRGGEKKGESILTNSIISSTETLVPLALSKLGMLSGDERVTDLLVNLCKGSIAVSAQFGSDLCLLLIFQSLLNSLCMNFDQRTKTIIELLIHIANRSALVRSALDPDGVLINNCLGTSLNIDKTEVTFYHQLKSLPSTNFESFNLLLGHLGKHCKELATHHGHEAARIQQIRIAEQSIVDKKRPSDNSNKNSHKRQK